MSCYDIPRTQNFADAFVQGDDIRPLTLKLFDDETAAQITVADPEMTLKDADGTVVHNFVVALNGQDVDVTMPTSLETASWLGTYYYNIKLRVDGYLETYVVGTMKWEKDHG